MAEVFITRKEHFNAAHKLWNANWSAEKNHEVFGKCANPNWHGHNFDLYVTVKGEPNPETGFVVNIKDLQKLLREAVVEPIDHKNLNVDVPFMEGKITSIENLALSIWEILAPTVKKMGAELYCVKLYETEKNAVAYYGN